MSLLLLTPANPTDPTQNFYGYHPRRRIGHLVTRIDLIVPPPQGKRKGATTLHLSLLDNEGVKWQVRPLFDSDTLADTPLSLLPFVTPLALCLFHRNWKLAFPPGFHDQRFYTHPSHEGMRAILKYIDQHERYERNQRRKEPKRKGVLVQRQKTQHKRLRAS